MKNINIKFLISCLLVASLVTGCKKSGYLTDGGVHTAITPLSNYDYLKQHSWNSFDTLIAIIDHFNLKDEVNQAGTFFAPTDNSIARFLKFKTDSVQLINENNKYSLADMFNQVSADSIRQYLFVDKYSLENTPEAVKQVVSVGKTNCGLQKILQTGGEYYQWGSTPVYSLYFTKIRGSLDDPNAAYDPNNPDNDTRVICQTTGILTNNGSNVLHVLANTHLFVRF
ncbi:MAG: hypothetical protein V4717_04835 [Bacteroidota bacterium]